MATQLFLWDSISSIKEPQKGVAVGDSWQSQLSIPSPMLGLINAGRDVVYKLEDVNDTASGRVAVISSEFSLSKSPLKDWFMPYTGSFMMSGPFGFYGNCRIVELGGKGRELFNIDAGRPDGYSQDYQMKVVATMSFIPVTPKINYKAAFVDAAYRGTKKGKQYGNGGGKDKLENRNLWAPWRIGYIQGLDKSRECFICHNLQNPQDDEKNLVLWRTHQSIVMLNRFPYNNGHLLIAPNRHIGGLDEANDDELLELMKLVWRTQKVLSLAIKPHGFNIGINFGRCAGAGLAGPSAYSRCPPLGRRHKLYERLQRHKGHQPEPR